MINADMRLYDFYIYESIDEYGQPQLGEKQTGIKMAINAISTSVQDDIRYKDATYLGLTPSPINDTYVIQYGEEQLKVLYVVPNGRLKQVYMKNL